MKKIVSVAVFAFSVSLAQGVWASEIVVDRYGRIDFGSAPIASDDAVFVDSGAGSVTKSGTGVWTLPLGNFLAFGSGFELGILGGTVSLTAGTTPDFVATPPDVLDDAAVWLEAGKNFTTNATGDVTAWYDAREASAAATSYGYAQAEEKVVTGEQQGVTMAVKNDRKAVAFRAKVSNIYRSLLLRTAAGTAATHDMYDGFYVVTPRGRSAGENQHAPILGNTLNGYFFSGNKGTGAMLSEEGNAEWKAYACTYRHNGVVEDPTVAIDGDACQLCEFSVYNSLTIPINSILRDRNLASGGIYLHEFLIFTRRLTSLERMQVTAYLMQKWRIETGVISIRGKDGDVVKTPDMALDKVNIVGDAAFGPAGDSLSPSFQYAMRDQTKRYRLEASGGRLNAQGTEYALRLADGDNITIDDSLTTNRAVYNAVGTAGTISIAGARRATVIDQVPATRLTATSDAGDIVLRARTKTASPYVVGGSVPATLSATSLSVPAGMGGATVSVTIPTAGDWEVEFDIQNNVGFQEGSPWTLGSAVSYRVTLVDHTDLLDKVALTVKPSLLGGVVPHRRYLIRGLAAGDYTLKFAGYAAGTKAASVSNLAFAFVPNPERETVVPVTEGDFESMSMNKPYFSSRDNLTSTYTRWVLANGVGVNPNPVVQSVVNSMMGVAVTSAGYDFQFRAHELGRYGDNALMWIHTNSTQSAVRNTATSPATDLPAGIWRLRMKACRMTTGPTTFDSRVSTNPDGANARCGKPLAKYQAKVKLNGGNAVDLGVTDEIDTFTGKTYYFPNPFTVPAEGASVVVDLDQLVGWSFSLTDDYEFVKVEDSPAVAEGLGPELIVDGSFESDGGSGTSHWTRDNYTDGSGNAHRVDIQNPIQEPYGKTRCDGNYVARSFNGSRCYQPVELDVGVYRLSYWSRARCDYLYGTPKGMPSNVCQLHFWYAAEGSAETNHIVSGDTLWCTNFYETTALFEVKTAGTYLVGFHADPWKGTDSLTDCVSVRKVLDTTAVPDVDPEADLTFRPTAGKVRLDYPGTLNVNRLRVNGKRLYGEVSAATHPQLLAGPGKVNVTGEPLGYMILIR